MACILAGLLWSSRASPHYKSDALLRTTRDSCSAPAFVHITLVNRDTDLRPRSPDYISNAAADSFVRTSV